MGGAVGAAPTQSGQQSAPQGGMLMGGLGPAQGPAQGVMPMGGGLPIAGGGGGELFAPRIEAQQAPQQQMQAPQQMQQQMRAPQQMYRPQALQSQGLQMLLNRMLSSYQQPQRALPPPQYQNRALAYRPNLAQAQANLGRTATTQAEAQAAAAAKAAENLAQAEEDQGFLNWQRQQYLASKNQNYGGG